MLDDADPSVVERLAEWVVGLRYDDIPERVRATARWQMASTVAAMHASHHSAAARSVRDAVLAWAQPGPCTLVPGGERIGSFDAVLVNSAYSIALDYDDYLYMGHTGHSSVLASLALCEALGTSTQDLLTAQVAANEIGGRLAASSVLGPQNGQAWSFIHAIGGAVVASKLHGLPVEQTAHALAIALYQPPFVLWPGFMGPGSKVLTAGGPTVSGMQAAAFARAGLTGARRIVEHPRKGFWAAFSWAPLPQMMGGLGRAWVSDTLAYKRYPGCAYVDTTLDAVLDVLAAFHARTGRALAPDEVRRVTVETNLLTLEMDNLSAEHGSDDAPLSPINVNFSVGNNLGIAIVAGAHEGSSLEQAFLDRHATAIRRIAASTRIVHDWAMSADVVTAFDSVLGRSGALAALEPGQLLAVGLGYRRQLGGDKRTGIGLGSLATQGALLGRLARAFGRGRARPSARSGAGSLDRPAVGEPPLDLAGVDFTRFSMRFPSRVTLETTRGDEMSSRQDVPWGAPGQERRFETVEEKVRREVARAMPADRVEHLLDVLRRFDDTSVADLAQALTPRT